MPLFGSRSKKEKDKGNSVKENIGKPDQSQISHSSSFTSNTHSMPATQYTEANGAAKLQHPEQQLAGRPKLVFHCQQAQGSPTGVISNFTNVKELYQKIAECYDMDPGQVYY